MIYIASTYSINADEALMQWRFEAACRYAGYLMNKGHVVYSPIAHCHHISKLCKLPTSWEFWKKFDTEMINRSDSLVVLTLEGWEQSKGIAAEVEIARQRGIPISYVNPVSYEPLPEPVKPPLGDSPPHTTKKDKQEFREAVEALNKALQAEERTHLHSYD